MLKVIFFDAVGTLIHLPKSVGEHYREIALRHGVNMEAPTLDRAFRREWAASPARQPTNGPRPDDDKSWWRDLVSRVLADALPADPPAGFDASAFFEELYAHFAAPGVWAAYPEALETLQTLRERGIALAVISNFDRRLHRVLESLGLATFFASVIISSEVGVEKPDPRIFAYALEALGVRPEEAAIVGDEPSDWAAGELGLRVARLERPAMTLGRAVEQLEEGLQSLPS